LPNRCLSFWICLPGNLPNTDLKAVVSPDMVAHACDSSTWEEIPGGFLSSKPTWTT
jgi:hypothetical protein